MNKTKHILGLSGGKDSAALAVHMNKKKEINQSLKVIKKVCSELN